MEGTVHYSTSKMEGTTQTPVETTVEATAPVPVLCRACKAGERDGFLHTAAQRGHVDCLKILLSRKKAKIDADDGSSHETAIGWAIVNHRLDIVKLLVEAGADVSIEEKEMSHCPLDKAVVAHDLEILEYLINLHPQPEEQRCEALIVACDGQHMSVFDHLLTLGVDVNYESKRKHFRAYQRTPILQAIANSHEDVVQRLIQHGANLDAPRKWFGNCLEVAISKGNTHIIQLLINGGVNIDTGNHIERTPLFQACHEGCEEIFKLLLDANANPHIRDRYGRSCMDELEHPPSYDKDDVVQAKRRMKKLLLPYVANYSPIDPCSYVLK